MNRWATASRDGFRVPMIGVPEDAVLEECDVCHDHFSIRDVRWTGRQFLCGKHDDFSPVPVLAEFRESRLENSGELIPVQARESTTWQAAPQGPTLAAGEHFERDCQSGLTTHPTVQGN